MKKLILALLFISLIMPFAMPQVFAAEETAQAGVVDAGNKMCPVMGGPVNGKNFVVYGGKRYGLCCSGCERSFLADPEKYIAQMGTTDPASSMIVTDASASEEMQKDMEQGDL